MSDKEKPVTTSAYEALKAGDLLPTVGRRGNPARTAEEKRERARLQILWSATARNRAITVLIAENEERFMELRAGEKAWLMDNDERFESLK